MTELSKAIRLHTERSVRRASETVRLGEVTDIVDLEIELLDSSVVLEEDEITIAQWPRLLLDNDAVSEGDTALVLCRKDGAEISWVVVDFLAEAAFGWADLSISGDLKLANTGKIAWGADTNLYRGGANLLKTDDDFEAKSVSIAAGQTFKVNGTQISSADLSDSVTGTGALVKATNPALAGTPTAPTAGAGTNTTQIATTAFVVGRTPADPAVGTAGLRTLGTGAQQAAAGDHTHATLPSSGEKSALAGTSGTPSGSNKYVTDGDTRLSKPRCKLRTPIAVPGTGSNTYLSWSAEDYDTAAMHDTVTNPTRVTVPEAGLYLLQALIHFPNNNTGTRWVGFRKNGTVLLAEATMPAVQTYASGLHVSETVELAAGDYIECWAAQTSGVSLTPNTAVSFFAVSRLA